MIVSGSFDLAYSVSSLNRFLAAPRVGYIDMARNIFGYLKNYPERGCAINPQPLKIYVGYEKVQIKYDFVN